MTQILEIQNDGPLLVATNYWSSEHAARGYYYLSFNAGTGRLLVPSPMEHFLPDMAAATHAVMTTGTLRGVASIEILFDDHSGAPFAIQLDARQADRLLDDHDRLFPLWAYTANGVAGIWRAVTRAGNLLPDLRPWPEHIPLRSPD